MRKGFSPGVVLGGIAVVLAMTGSAVAASAITSSQIKDGTIQSKDIRKGTIALNRLAPALQARFSTVGQPGPKGDSGAAGPQGAKGDPGPSVFGSPLAGAAGPAGPAGPVVATAGAKGDTGAAGADGAKGDTGAKGEKGDVGPAGANGENGAPGAKGEKGDVGPAGANGENGAPGAKGDKGDAGPQGPAGVLSPLAASLTAPVAIKTIGGPINDGYTDLNTSKTLPAGTYIVTVDAAFESAQAAADPLVEVYPQVSLWIDKNRDNKFSWQTEGDISPNAIMPVAKNRHISTSGVTQVTLTEATKVGLVAHGYSSTQGTERSGEIDVVRAVLGALRVAAE